MQADLRHIRGYVERFLSTFARSAARLWFEPFHSRSSSVFLR